MARSAAESTYRRQHEKRPWHNGTFTSWVEHPSKSHPYYMDVGLRFAAAQTDLAPWDDFMTNPNASPLPPSDETPDDSEGVD
jgi:hypothetical protein